MRVLGDAISFASKSEALLRQILSQAGVMVSAKVDLELPKYLNNRGEKSLILNQNRNLKILLGPKIIWTKVSSNKLKIGGI